MISSVSRRREKTETYHQVLRCYSFQQSSLDNSIHEDDFGKFDSQIIFVAVSRRRVRESVSSNADSR